MGVGVGRGTSIFCPITRLLQAAGKLLRRMMLWNETSNARAMLKQLSLDAIVYSIGGIGVNVGWGVGVSVDVGVKVRVAVVVGDGMGVGSSTRPLEDNVKYTAAAPIVTNNANNPNASGRLSVNSGIRLP